MFGQKKHGDFLAPGMDFAFGFTGDGYIDRALQNDWLICNDSVVSPASSNALEDLQLRISLEPIRDLKNRSYRQSHPESQPRNTIYVQRYAGYPQW